MRPERFELPTCCSGGNRSIQLSYGRAGTVYMAKREGSNATAIRSDRYNALADRGMIVPMRCKGELPENRQGLQHLSVNFFCRVLPAIASPAAAPTAAAPTAISPVPAASAATAAAALSLGASLIDVDGAPADLRSVQRRNRFLAVFVAGHLHEAEAARAPSITVRHNAYAVHLTVRLEKLPQFVFVGVEAQISHKDILHASASALSCRKCKLSSADLAGREGRS